MLYVCKTNTDAIEHLKRLEGVTLTPSHKITQYGCGCCGHIQEVFEIKGLDMSGKRFHKYLKENKLYKGLRSEAIHFNS